MPSRQSFTLEELLRRPQVDYAMLEAHGHGRPGGGGGLGRWQAEAVEVKVGRCSLILSKPVLKASMASALEARLS